MDFRMNVTVDVQFLPGKAMKAMKSNANYEYCGSEDSPNPQMIESDLVVDVANANSNLNILFFKLIK
jgi:hypothetical protein